MCNYYQLDNYYHDINHACYFAGDVENAGINRSPSAYLLNPAEERARYPANVDKQMTLLKFVDSASGESIGAFSWYATHGTSMTRDNKLISGDNKGAAARFFEDWFTSTPKSNSTTVTNLSTTSGKYVQSYRKHMCIINNNQDFSLFIFYFLRK